MITPYLRYPHAAAGLLTFIADDDVWLTPETGGRAFRVSADRVRVSHPRLSPDGRQIAWVSTRDGAAEVYICEADGGLPRRLTYWGRPATTVSGWIDERTVLVVSDHADVRRSRSTAWSLPADGSPATRLAFGWVGEVALGSAGAVLATSAYYTEPARWKRYRGGTAGKLWLDRAGSGEFRRLLPEVRAGLVCPVWLGPDRIGFVADLDGPAALYGLDVADGVGEPQRLAGHDFYIRHATSTDGSVVYACAGELWRYTGRGVSERLNVTLGGGIGGRTPYRAPAGKHLGPIQVDRTGRASAIEIRGTVQWLTHRDGPARALASGSGVRGRLPTPLGDGGSVAWVSDADGEDGIDIGSREGDGDVRRLGTGDIGRVLELAASPDGSTLAIACHDGRLLTVDVAGGAIRELDRTADGDVSGLAFSPDSAWLAWSHPGPEPLRQIRLAELAGGRVIQATPLRFTDTEPTFTPDGSALAFLSVRSFDPVYDAVVFDVSFPGGCRPQLLPLLATTPSPFDPTVEGRAADLKPSGDARAELERQDDGGSSGERPETAAGAPVSTAPVTVRVDVDGLSDRVVPFPVDAAQYSSLRAQNGAFTWLREPTLGAVGDDLSDPKAKPKPALQRFAVATRTVETLAEHVDRYAQSGDGKRLVTVDGETVQVIPADHKAETDSDAHPGTAAAEVVEVDLSRVRVEVDPGIEWRQAYAEAGRLMRDHFWRPDMGGLDWAGVQDRYRPLLDRICSQDDFIDLLWEVQAELGSSHAYVSPPAEDPLHNLGHLGADIERAADGAFTIRRVLPGEPSAPRARCPLLAPGVAVHPGDAILAVDGRPVDPITGPASSLVDAADTTVELTIRPADGGPVRHVVVTPLADDQPLRYQAWVNDRRAHVHDISAGRIGYLHVPDMVGSGWAQLHRDLRLEIVRDGVVLDLRENTGGHLSELVVAKLAQRVHGWTRARGYRPYTYPVGVPRGPVVTVVDEHAGSDGDIATAAIKALGVGPVVGTRSWGGVVGIDGRYQLNGGIRVTQPRYAFWLEGYGWGVENHGVDPDIEVEVTPQDVVAGRDPQLDTAVRIALERLEQEPAATVPAPPPV